MKELVSSIEHQATMLEDARQRPSEAEVCYSNS